MTVQMRLDGIDNRSGIRSGSFAIAQSVGREPWKVEHPADSTTGASAAQWSAHQMALEFTKPRTDPLQNRPFTANERPFSGIYAMTFYKLQVSRARTGIEGASQNDWESIVCPKDAGHQRAGRRITPLYLDVLSRNVADFSRTMLSDVVITQHAFDVLREAGLTGFEVRPTKVKALPPRVKRFDLPELWEFVVTGHGGPADKASGIVQLLKCDGCGLIRYSAYEHGIKVDEFTYDGADFFTVSEYPKYVLVTPRARAAIEHARLTNVAFIESSEVERPKGVAKPRPGVV